MTKQGWNRVFGIYYKCDRSFIVHCWKVNGELKIAGDRQCNFHPFMRIGKGFYSQYMRKRWGSLKRGSIWTDEK